MSGRIHVANHEEKWGMISFRDTRQDYGTSPMMNKNGKQMEPDSLHGIICNQNEV
jgi:hypothetical protein